ncbi:peptidyl-prolyl cis-trans isomerase [Fodinibius sp.]|uniref:peptidyl-prolyl cis-trans isomerase n=1 Tax=Fodinibius sp. TaxID=1872440 RepID=UPI002ACD6F02|nr:peptidyl-prolyl cis-trans isomerase [Fodinibius sp.]MDZ7660227.1 peptidyl-prolyl cis-trans isomerase [Fodinibius sp.]
MGSLKSYKFYFLIVIGIILSFTSCQQKAHQKPEDTLARVGSEYLTVDQAVNDIPEAVLSEDSVRSLTQYRDNWIRQQLLVQEARRLGLEQKPKIQQKIEQARQEILRQALKDYVLASSEKDLKITDEEARTYYQANKEQFVLEEDFVKFRHMRTKTIKQARNARQDLLDGVPWPEVARTYAINPSTVISESDQYWPISMAAKDIDIMNRYLKVIGQSEISPIQRVNGVYHFVQLIETRSEGDHPNLEWLIEQIKDWMTLNNRQRNFSSFVKNLYLKAESNNEVETFNVLPTKSNQNSTIDDTLENNSTNE